MEKKPARIKILEAVKAIQQLSPGEFIEIEGSEAHRKYLAFKIKQNLEEKGILITSTIKDQNTSLIYKL